LFLGKSTKTAATGAALFDSNMHQIVCRLRLCLRPHWGAYSSPPDPELYFGGLLLKGGEGSSFFGLGRKQQSRRPCLIRGFATPWTYFLLLSLSSVILIDSFTGSPVHVLMLSSQAVRGLPRLRAPGIVPCIISFSKQLPRFLMV